jgi:hypothetical protein
MTSPMINQSRQIQNLNEFRGPQKRSSSDCINSDNISPSYYYTNDNQTLEFENNENELMKLDEK